MTHFHMFLLCKVQSTIDDINAAIICGPKQLTCAIDVRINFIFEMLREAAWLLELPAWRMQDTIFPKF